MIDLRLKELPSALVVDGVPYPIMTDFRTWIEVERSLREDGQIPYWIFIDEHPPFASNWMEAAMEFLTSPNRTPKNTKQSKEQLFDFIDDGDYIVAAFQQAYGIDLTMCDMHWHRFLALFSGLPDDTKMAKIIGYRCYDSTDKRKHETVMNELKREWSLGMSKKQEEEIIKWQKMVFGNIGKEVLNE